jgi:hypothetical protein
MSQTGKFWQAVDKRSKKTQNAVTSVGVVTSLKPFGIKYNGIDISVENGDTIFVNNLMLDDVVSFTEAQPITCSHGEITENHTDIINNEIESWLVSVHNRFILHIGDYIAVQKLGNNTYIVLEKLQKVENEQ